jgi:hypothetical protein
MTPRDVKRRLHQYSRAVVTETSARLGLFRRLRPISSNYGFPRGTPIDRHFIENFVARHRADIKGRVLEGAVGYCYGRQFGDDRVLRLDLMAPEPRENATLVADLATGEGIPIGVYDCLLLTQVFNFIYDAHSAAAQSWHALKPGGVLLATLEGIGATHRQAWELHWRFTETSARRLFGEVFGPENVAVETYGNVFSACALLQCLAAEDLNERELSFRDPAYQVTIAVRAVKASGDWPAPAG